MNSISGLIDQFGHVKTTAASRHSAGGLRGGWKLVISDARNRAIIMLRDDVIIRAAIVAHSKRRTRFTPRAPPPLFGTKLAQWILLGEL